MSGAPKILNLHEVIGTPTPEKEPGKTVIPTLKEPKPAAPAKPTRLSSAAWNSDDDFEREPETTPAATGSDNPAASEVKKGPSPREIKASARQIVGMVNMTQRMIFSKLAANKFKNSFTKDQALKYSEIEFKNNDDPDEGERRLKAFFQRKEKKFEKIIESIPLTAEERGDLEEAAIIYQEETGKTLPKWMFSVFALMHAVGKRTMDIYFD